MFTFLHLEENERIKIQECLLFATVPGSSINSWDSWFIFNLGKNKHLLLHNIFVHREDQKRMLVVTSKFVYTSIT